MNFYNTCLQNVRTTEEKLQSIEKQIADNVYPVGSSWYNLLIHLRDVYKKELQTKS